MAEPAETGSRLEDYSLMFRKFWWKSLLIAVAAGLAMFMALLRLPNIYRATAVVAPAPEEMKQIPALGALASFGLMVGGPTKVEDLETLFRSDDLTVRVFRKHHLWLAILGDQYDPGTGTVTSDWIHRLLGGQKERKTPGDWDAIRAARSNLKVSVNKRSGTVSIAFESRSAEDSARIVAHYIEEGKGRLQEEALGRANRNKQFIGEQIAKTIDPLTRDRLYALYGQEVEREMLAKNREQFGFRLIDAPRVPDRKIRPGRTQGAILAFIVGFLASCGVFLIRGTKL